MKTKEEIQRRLDNLKNGTELMREDGIFPEAIYFNKILMSVLEWVLKDDKPNF